MKKACKLVLIFVALLAGVECFSQSVVWNGNGDGASWSNPQNWVGQQVPAATNNVVITSGAGTNVVISSAVSVESLQCTKAFTISSGSLTVTVGPSSVSGMLTVANGAFLSATGSNTTFTSSGAVVIGDASLYVSGGATLSLPGLVNFNDANGASPNWQASGPGSLLVLTGLTNVAGPFSYYSRNALLIQALAGGEVSLDDVVSISNGVVQVEADGVGSEIDLSALEDFVGSTEDSAFSQLQPSDGGTILTKELGTLTDVTAVLGGGTLDLDTVTNLSGSSVTVTNGVVTLANVVDIDDASLYATNGATLSLPGVVTCDDSSGSYPTWQAGGLGSVVFLAGLTNVVGPFTYYSNARLLIQALAGSEVNLPGLISIPNGVIQVEADGLLSQIDFSSLQEFNGSTEDSASAEMQPSGSATILTMHLGNLTGVSVFLGGGGLNLSTVTNLSGSTLTMTNGRVALQGVVDINNASFYISDGAMLSLSSVKSCDDSSGAYPVWQASGSGSSLSLNGITNVTGPYSYYSNDGLLIQALAGGQVNLLSLVSVSSGVVQVNANGSGSEVSLSSMQNFDGSDEGGASSQLQAGAGGTVLAGKLGSLNGVTASLGGTGTLNLTAVTNLSGTTVTVTNGSVTLPNVTDIDNTSFYVSGGATLSLPGVTNCDNSSGADSAWHASGSGSSLSLNGITNVAGPYNYYSTDALLIEALAGGQINLGELSSISSGVVQVQSSGVGSEVNLSSMKEFVGAAEGSASSQLQPSNGGTILTEQLENLTGVTVTVGGGALNLYTVTNLSGTSLTMTNGALTLTNVTDIANTSLYVSSGATLSLPGVVDCDNSAGSYAVWQASGPGSLLALTSLTNAVGPYSYYSSFSLQIQALAGGEVNLGELNSFSTGVVQIQSSGADSEIVLSALQDFDGSIEGSASSQLQPGNGGTVQLGQLASLTGVIVTLGGGTLNLNSVTNLNNSTLNATNGAVTLANVTDIDNASFYVTNAAKLSLPGVFNCNDGGSVYPVWQAGGVGSVLNLTGLTNLVAPYVQDSTDAIAIQALDGGEINLGSLISIASGNVQAEAIGNGSEVNLSQLVNYVPANTTLTTTNGGTIPVPQFVDLSVANLAVPPTGVLGQPVTVTFTITNLTSVSAAGPWQNQFLLSTNPSGTNAQSLGTVLFTNSITGRGSDSVTQSLILPTGVLGPVYLGVTVNSSDSLPETTLTNNTVFSPTPTVITAVQLSLTHLTAPMVAQFGQTISISFSVTNVGTATANSPWIDQVYLSESPTSLVGATLLTTIAGTSPLAPGAGYTRNQTVTLPLSSHGSPGAYNILAIADAADALIESSRAANIRSIPIDLSQPGLPDLAVSEVTAPATAAPGSTVTLTWTVTNQGALNITNGTWTEAVGISNVTGSVSMLADFRFTNSLNVGSFLTRSEPITLFNGTPAGNDLFFVTVNSGGDVIENPSNNTTFAANFTTIPAALSFVMPVTSVNENTSLPNLACLISRNGNLTSSVAISLASSGVSHLVVPATVTIQAGQSSAPFTATVLDDGIVDSNAAIAISAQATGYLSATTQVVVINTDVPQLSLSLSSPQISEGQMASATVTSDVVSAQPVVVSISSSSSAALAVPSMVTIPANSNSVSFVLTASQNTVIAPAQTYTITASAPGIVSASSNLTVLNINTPTLTLSLDRTNVSEADGPLAAIATVSRLPATDQPLTVALISTNPAAARVLSQIIIPPYQGNATFCVAAVADLKSTGSNVTQIAAQALDIASNAVGTPATAELTVQNTNGPVLSVVIAKKVVAKALNPATTALVSRNTPPTNNLVVNLTCSVPAEAAVPAQVTILAGQTNVSFEIASLDDGNIGTSESVSITASAADYSSGSDVFAVTDLELPDLVINNVSAPGAVITGQSVNINFNLENQGLAALTNGVAQNIYLTTDPSSGDNLLVGSVAFPGPLAPGQKAALSVLVPADSLPPPGTYWVLVTANSGATAAESNPANDTGISLEPLVVNIDYTAEVQAGLTTVPAGTPVRLSGTATLSAGGPATNVQVNLIITVHGLPRTLSVYTDTNGNFSTTFTPLATEAGTYTVTAVAPGITSGPVQTEFNILGITASPSSLAMVTVVGTNAGATVSLQNTSDIPLTGLTATTTGVAANLTANVILSTNVVTAQSGFTLDCTVAAANSTISQSSFNIHITSAEGAVLDVAVAVTVAPPSPLLVTSPAQLRSSMLSGGQTVVQFSVANLGGVASGPLIVALPNVPWINIASPSPLPSLNPGQSNLVTLVLTPGTNLALGPYGGQLAINGSGLGIQVPFTFNNVSDANGSLLVQSVDELTFFAVGEPPLTNASVTVIDPLTQGVVASGATDSNGFFSVPVITAGSYQVNVTAPQHSPLQGTAVVTPAETNNFQAFLSLETVSFSWSVVPTQIQAQAQVTIQATYVANVPAPVIVPSPTSLDFSSLTQPGQFMDVSITLANYGLIAVDNVAISIDSGSYYKIDAVATSLGTLAAHGSITVPLRVTLLSLPPSPNTAHPRKDDGGSGCITIGISYGYPCGGYLVGKAIPMPVFNAVGQCESPTTPAGEIYITGGPIYGSGGQIDFIPSGQIVPDTCDSDPCVDKRLGAMAKCALGFIKLPIPKVIKCFNSAYKCGTGLVESCGGGNGAKCGLVIAKCLYSGIGCSGSLGAALASKIGWVGTGLTIIGCSYDICTACQSIGYSGVCGSTAPGGAGGGGGSTPKIRFDVPVGADADVIFGPLFAEANGIEAEISPDIYFFNNDTWFNVTDTNSVATLLNQFDGDVQTNSDGGSFITAAERTNLLAMPLPAPLALSDLEALIDRWNLTMSNYTAGIFDVSQAPPGADTNFIDFDYWISLNGAAATAVQTYTDLGYEDAADAWLSTRNALLAEYEGGQTGVCAEIVLQIDQTAVLTLNAFNATLQMNNSGANSLSNVMANIVVKNPAGQDVTSLFAIASPTLSGALTAVDGSGVLSSGASGSAQWTLVPTQAAAPEAPTNYLVSGSLSYTLGSATVTIPLAPTTINVQPDPQLYLKYFLQRDVFGDNPYTPQIEPSVPFPMAVMVQNQGYGEADNFQITSARPQIVDNEKGLLIGFDIIGTQVDAQPVSPSLTVNFGDILPQQTKVGIWYMTCTLDGQFIGYQASYENLTSLGNTQLSVIDGAETHLMTHMVQADRAWDDGLPDFLVDDIPNLGNLPETIYLSGGGIQPVSVVQSASVSSPVSSAALQVQLTANFPAGFSFVLIPDPAKGQFPLQSVLYSNGTSFLTNNFWITDRTFQGIGFAPILQTNLQLFVYHTNAGPDTFTLQYALPPVISNTNAPISSVFALPAQSPPAFGVVWSGTTDAGAAALAYFDIYSSDNGGSFLLWQSQVTNNSAIFNGTTGHTYSFYSVATDVAGHRETTPLQPQSQTLVALNSNAPSISIVPSVSLNAGQTLSLGVTASDPNPQAILSFTLGPGAPVGVVVNPLTGQISWATSPTFGGTTNLISVIVSDNGQPQLSATGTVAVVLLQVISPPTLAPIANYTIAESSLLTFTNSATDTNLPPRLLTFSLGAGAPTNATIDPVTGIFQWRPTAAQAPSTNIISVIVTDNGTPPLSATQQFTVIVNPVTFEFLLSFGYTNLLVGETNTVPVTLTSLLPLTNITAILQASDTNLTNLVLLPASPEVMETFLQSLGESRYAVSFTLNPALSPGNTRTLAQLSFVSVPEVHSAIAPLVVSQPAGTQQGGVPVAKPGSANGRVIIVGLEPVLDAVMGTNPIPTLTIYGNLGSNYQLAFTTNLALTNWQSAGSILITNQQQNFNVNQSMPEIYYRAQ